MQSDKAEWITITLPSEMLVSIKDKVQSGAYGSTGELIREAMRLWQKKRGTRSAAFFNSRPSVKLGPKWCNCTA